MDAALETWNNGVKIIGGKDASIGEYPWQISIMMNPVVGGPYHYCGGSILDSTHIVTAAHCVKGKSISQMHIVAGAHNIKDSTEASQQKVYIKRMVYHPDFDR